ncbi:MAG TPA: Sec-independent protein translocase protein TatB [Allosphingosinicella sp.]
MFGVDSSELFLIVLVAVVVIGPKDLPRVMRTIGHWVGRARGMANQFKSGVDQMVRDSEIADLEKKWREQNEAIMRAHPAATPDSDWGMTKPPPALPPEAGPVSLTKPPPTPDPAGGDMGEASAAAPGQVTPGRRKPPAAPPPLVKPAYPAAVERDAS